MKGGPERITRAFVDAMDEGIARLVVDGARVEVPAAMLPEGAVEGAWLEIRIREIPEPASGKRAVEERRRLGARDDGGDFGL